LVFCAQQNV